MLKLSKVSNYWSLIYDKSVEDNSGVMAQDVWFFLVCVADSAKFTDVWLMQSNLRIRQQTSSRPDQNSNQTRFWQIIMNNVHFT